MFCVKKVIHCSTRNQTIFPGTQSPRVLQESSNRSQTKLEEMRRKESLVYPHHWHMVLLCRHFSKELDVVMEAILLKPEVKTSKRQR